MDKSFNADKAKEFLEIRQTEEREKNEKDRKAVLALIIGELKILFANTEVEVYLVGSVIRPHAFSLSSDVDVVVKNFQGDRFDIWTKLEAKIKRDVEVILFENCHFQEYVVTQGYKVL